jgi:hypothetical protein
MAISLSTSRLPGGTLITPLSIPIGVFVSATVFIPSGVFVSAPASLSWACASWGAKRQRTVRIERH